MARLIEINTEGEVLAINGVATQFLDLLDGLAIKDARGAEVAADLRGMIIDAIKDAKARLERVRRPIKDAYDAVTAEFKPDIDRLEAAKDRVDAEITRWGNEQRRLLEAQRAEQLRLEAERREAALKEAARIEAEAAKEAAQAEESGDAATAAVVQQTAVVEAAAVRQLAAAPAAAPLTQVTKPAVAGVGMRESWKFEIVDPSRINAAFMVPDEKLIGKTVTQHKGNAATLIGPGIRVWREDIPVDNRGRRKSR